MQIAHEAATVEQRTKHLEGQLRTKEEAEAALAATLDVRAPCPMPLSSSLPAVVILHSVHHGSKCSLPLTLG